MAFIIQETIKKINHYKRRQAKTTDAREYEQATKRIEDLQGFLAKCIA